MPTLEHVAALAFRDELLKIANAGVANDNDFEKSAAVDLFNAMPLDQVEWFLKEANFGAMLSGAWTGAKGLAGGMASKGLSYAKGALGGVKDRVVNTAKGMASSIGRAPGAINQKLYDWGGRMAGAGTQAGNRMKQEGIAGGAALRSRIGGPAPSVPSGRTPVAGQTSTPTQSAATPGASSQNIQHGAPMTPTGPTAAAPQQAAPPLSMSPPRSAAPAPMMHPTVLPPQGNFAQVNTAAGGPLPTQGGGFLNARNGRVRPPPSYGTGQLLAA